MQKIFISCFCLLWSGFALGQITITENDMPIPGMLPMFSLPDSASLMSADIMQTGANQSWDFSFFVPQFQRVDTFVSLAQAGSTYQFSFSGATVARVLPVGGGGGAMGVTISSGFDFFKATNNDYEKLGSGGVASIAPFPLSLVNNPVDIVYRFPMNYGNIDSSYSEAVLNIPTLVYLRQQQTRTNMVDGWGTLTTPFKSFDALRINTHLRGYDSIAYNGFNIGQPSPPRNEIKWYSNSEKVPVLTINVMMSQQTGLLTPTSASYRDTAQNVPYVGIDQIQPLQTKIYPNPTTDLVHIEWETILGGNAQLAIYDYNGNIVHQQSISKDKQLILNTHTFPAGEYIVKVWGEKQQFSGTLMVKR